MNRIAIVGGGFSGTLVLAQLVDKVAAGTRIDLYEASGVFGPGLAYGTSDNGHLLNVPAGRMGAFEPDHFLLWLASAEGVAAAAQLWPGRQSAAGDYLPRALYGRYVESILAIALRRATERGVHVSLLPGKVLDVVKSSSALVILRARIGRKQSRRAYDALVLATGNHSPRPPKIATGWGVPSAFAANPWAALQDPAFISKLRRLSASDTVFVLGTGLTAVDAVLSLEHSGFPGRIIALSRRGLLPTVHLPAASAPWTWQVPPAEVAPTALAVFRWLKRETRAAGEAWRSVFDAARPVTAQIWARLPAGEQLRLLRRHSLWSVHRHRMAPEVAKRIASLRSAGRLEVIAGKLISLSAGFGLPRLRYQRRGAAASTIIRPAFILNCTGTDYDLRSDALLASLVKGSFVQTSPHCLGLVPDEHNGVHGALPSRIFAIGAPLFGSLFETTAVPELRGQARIIAERIAEHTLPHS